MEINDLLAYDKINERFTKDYNELYDILYYYMKTYLEKDMRSNYLFADEVENILGIRDHKKIVDYILKL